MDFNKKVDIYNKTNKMYKNKIKEKMIELHLQSGKSIKNFDERVIFLEMQKSPQEFINRFLAAWASQEKKAEGKLF